MAECKHEQHMLLGTAEGIICRGCGKLFLSYADIYPPEDKKPTESPRKPQKRKSKTAVNQAS